MDLWRRQLCIRPLGDEIRQDLGLNGLARGVGERFTDHLAILPAASGLRMISPNGKEETTVTGWALK
jgi:hypothetical protein